MSFYRQSIILFGFVLPFVVCAAVVFGGQAFRSSAEASFQKKQSLYKSSEMNRLQALGMEAQVTKKRPHFQRWMDQLEKETANTITSHLKEISEKYTSKEFQQTQFERPGGKAGFGTASANNSSQVKLGFRGTYQAVQLALLELETRMPQLQLQELKVDPASNSNSTLNFQFTYTAWEK